MRTPSQQAIWQREELLHLLSLSGTLAGLCITGVAVFHTIGRGSLPATAADDCLAIAALLHLLCAYVIFVALRMKRPRVTLILERIAEGLFLFALTGMVASGFIMVYTVW